MTRAQMRNWILGPMILLPVLSNAQGGDEVCVIQVAPGDFSAYGHWISEDGEVELRYSYPSGTLFADGWQINPGLTMNQGPAVVVGYDKLDRSELSPQGRLEIEVCEMRDSMFAQKASATSVTEACMDKLRNSGLVDLSATSDEGAPVVDGIQHVGGPIYRIYWTGGEIVLMNLGRQEIPPTEEHLQAVRRNASYALFHRLAEHLQAGEMYIQTAYPLPRGVFVPRHRKEEVASILRKAGEASSEITQETWQQVDDDIAYGFAEQMRNPLPISRKEGR